MPDSIPNKVICECGQVHINHYPSQIINHRLSKKHALKLMDRINLIEKKKLDKIKEKEKKGTLILTFD